MSTISQPQSMQSPSPLVRANLPVVIGGLAAVGILIIGNVNITNLSSMLNEHNSLIVGISSLLLAAFSFLYSEINALKVTFDNRFDRMEAKIDRLVDCIHSVDKRVVAIETLTNMRNTTNN